MDAPGVSTEGQTSSNWMDGSRRGRGGKRGEGQGEAPITLGALASLIDSNAYKVVFRYSLLVLKIYCIRNASCRYWILAANNGTQLESHILYIHILNYMTDIFTKQIHVEKVYLTFELKPLMRKLENDNGLEMFEISVLFSYRKLISNCWYYLSILPCLLIK